MIKIIQNYKSVLWQIVFAWLFILMITVTLKYIPFSSNVAFLQIKQTEVHEIKSYLNLFYVHVYSAIFCLFAGFTQFNDFILNKHSLIHKYIGKLYVIIILFFAAPSGFYIGWYANGGIYSKVSFVLLAIFWFYFTCKGFLEIKSRKINSHKNYMLRSFALTFSAITLRLWKVILVYLFHPAPMDLYQLIAWLGWIPNLIFVEFFIIKKIIK